MKTQTLVLAILFVACGPVQQGGDDNEYSGGEGHHMVVPPDPNANDGGPGSEGMLCGKSSDCPWSQLCFAKKGSDDHAICQFKGKEDEVGCRPQPQFSDCDPGLYCLDVNGNPETDLWGICTKN